MQDERWIYLFPHTKTCKIAFRKLRCFFLSLQFPAHIIKSMCIWKIHMVAHRKRKCPHIFLVWSSFVYNRGWLLNLDDWWQRRLVREEFSFFCGRPVVLHPPGASCVVLLLWLLLHIRAAHTWPNLQGDALGGWMCESWSVCVLLFCFWCCLHPRWDWIGCNMHVWIGSNFIICVCVCLHDVTRGSTCCRVSGRTTEGEPSGKKAGSTRIMWYNIPLLYCRWLQYNLSEMAK